MSACDTCQLRKCDLECARDYDNETTRIMMDRSAATYRAVFDKSSKHRLQTGSANMLRELLEAHRATWFLTQRKHGHDTSSEAYEKYVNRMSMLEFLTELSRHEK